MVCFFQAPRMEYAISYRTLSPHSCSPLTLRHCPLPQVCRRAETSRRSLTSIALTRQIVQGLTEHICPAIHEAHKLRQRVGSTIPMIMILELSQVVHSRLWGVVKGDQNQWRRIALPSPFNWSSWDVTFPYSRSRCTIVRIWAKASDADVTLMLLSSI